MLIVGLGNPGESYRLSRHNVGFIVLEALRHRLTEELFHHEKLLKAEIVKIGQKVLIKPMTFMNNSGQAVKATLKFKETSIEDIWVIHDDADLPFGTVKIKQGGTSGGHKGIISIDEAIGSEYWRIRIGIGRPDHGELTDFVLQPFLAIEQIKLGSIIDRTVDLLVYFFKTSIKTKTFHVEEKNSRD